MYVTHTNSVYSENITLIDDVPYPQYAHEVANSGGMPVDQGIKTRLHFNCYSICTSTKSC